MAQDKVDVAGGRETAAVEIRLSKLQQLFNSLDPSPFHEKDLDADAEEYIVGSVDEFPLQQPLKLVIHLPADQIALAEGGGVERGIHNYFDHRVGEIRRRLKFLLREGRIALLIGLVFLFICMILRQLAYAFGQGALSDILAEGLLILGWVAMWRPLQIFLYEWWPLRHHGRVYAKLSTMPIELRQTSY